ncbi:MAG: hypothetical protein KY449_13760 [Proteobacteria bacterium]|nr:hypothetical protein [Pseudomonadota bacterium]
MKRYAILIAVLFCAETTLGQTDAEKYMREAEKLEAGQNQEATLIEHLAEVQHLIALCNSDYRLSDLGERMRNQAPQWPWVEKLLQLGRQPTKLNKPRACYELLTKYGPQGNHGRGWIDKATR